MVDLRGRPRPPRKAAPLTSGDLGTPFAVATRGRHSAAYLADVVGHLVYGAKKIPCRVAPIAAAHRVLLRWRCSSDRSRCGTQDRCQNADSEKCFLSPSRILRFQHNVCYPMPQKELDGMRDGMDCYPDTASSHIELSLILEAVCGLSSGFKSRARATPVVLSGILSLVHPKSTF